MSTVVKQPYNIITYLLVDGIENGRATATKKNDAIAEASKLALQNVNPGRVAELLANA